MVKKDNRNKGKTATREHHRPYSAQPTYGEVDENLVAGRNAVRELLSGGRDVDKIFTARGERDGSITLLVAEAIERRIPVVEVDRKKLDDMTGGMRHQGIVALAAERDYSTVEDIIRDAEERGEDPLIVIADEIVDPHNLGAIIRSAECAGAHGIVIPKRRASGLTAVVAKSSAGAIEHMRIARVANLAGVVAELKEKGFWIYAADMDGTPYYETDLRGRVALILGNEGNGIRRLLKENADFSVSIPMYGKVNSLNVSAAAAVLLFEAARQRRSKSNT